MYPQKCTQEGMVGIQWCTQGDMVGIVGYTSGCIPLMLPRVYTSHATQGVYLSMYPGWIPPYIHSMYQGWIPPYIHHPTTLGIPRTPTTVPVYLVMVYSVLRVREVRPWAQRRRNPWVGGRRTSQDPKGVMVDGRLCAELLRASLLKLGKIG